MTYAIGDIHGMFEPLVRLFQKLPLKSDDTLIFLGDYIDRGPNSREVVEFLENLKKQHNTILLMGNHEDMMLKCLEHGDCINWEFNGAGATIRSFGSIENIKEKLDFFKSLKLYHIEDKFLFVHGGVKPGVPLRDQPKHEMLWIRDEFIFSKNPLPGKVVVFGHTPIEKPYIAEDKIGIDTGCVYGGMLTAIRLDDLKIFSVSCR